MQGHLRSTHWALGTKPGHSHLVLQPLLACSGSGRKNPSDTGHSSHFPFTGATMLRTQETSPKSPGPTISLSNQPPPLSSLLPCGLSARIPEVSAALWSVCMRACSSASLCPLLIGSSPSCRLVFRALIDCGYMDAFKSMKSY